MSYGFSLISSVPRWSSFSLCTLGENRRLIRMHVKFNKEQDKGKANNSIHPRTTPFFPEKGKRAALGGIRTHNTAL